MRVEASVEINAPPAVVWGILVDVEQWPQWTASMTSVRRLDDGEFRRGSTVRIKQPRFPAMTWQVTELNPGSSFTWETSSPGGRSVAKHSVALSGDGSRVTLSVDQTGALMAVLARLTARTTRRYVAMEAAGLRKRAESTSH